MPRLDAPLSAREEGNRELDEARGYLREAAALINAATRSVARAASTASTVNREPDLDYGVTSKSLVGRGKLAERLADLGYSVEGAAKTVEDQKEPHPAE